MEEIKLQSEQVEALIADWKIGDEELKIMGVSREEVLEADLAKVRKLMEENWDRNVKGQDKPRIDSFLSLLSMRMTPPPVKKPKKKGKTSIIDLHDIALEGFKDDEVSLSRYATAVKISEGVFRGVKQLKTMAGAVIFGGIQVSEDFAVGMHPDFVTRRRFLHVVEGHNFIDDKIGAELAGHLEEEIGANKDQITFIDTKFGLHQFRIELPLEVSIDWTNADASEPHQVIWDRQVPVGRRKWTPRSVEEVQEMLAQNRAEILERVKASLKGPKYMDRHIRDHGIRG